MGLARNVEATNQCLVITTSHETSARSDNHLYCSNNT